jgi:hypothetical protein
MYIEKSDGKFRRTVPLKRVEVWDLKLRFMRGLWRGHCRFPTKREKKGETCGKQNPCVRIVTKSGRVIKFVDKT